MRLPPRLAGLAVATVLAVIIGTALYMATRGTGYMDVSDLAGVDGPALVTVAGVVVNYSSDPDADRLVLLLADEEGNATVLAVMSLQRFASLHGRGPGPWIVGSEIIVKGTFYPEPRGGALGWIDVSDLLAGCHEAYSAPQAGTG